MSQVYFKKYIIKKGWLGFSLVVLLMISCKKYNAVNKENEKQYLSERLLVPEAENNIIQNSSFEQVTENTFANWTPLGTGTFSATTVQGEVYDGTNALKVINPTSNGSSGFSKLGIMTDSIATQVGVQYVVRIWARSGSTSSARIGFTALGSPTQYVPNQAISTSWKAYEWRFYAKSNFVRIRLDLGADANTYFIDSTSMIAIDKVYSQIWGVNGEAWDTARIPDFTNAGYMNGNSPIPDYPVSVDVTTLGAVGDGVTDNTAFFKAAIKQCATNGTVYIPAGKYLLSDTLMIKKSGINIKGEGAATILYFTKGIEELYPRFNKPGSPANQSPWSWEGGMITFSGNISGSGIQSLKIEFPDSAWAGHDFHERGYNGIGFSNKAHDGWIKNVTLTGCDLGIWIARDVKNITVEKWKLDCGPVRAAGPNAAGHHGVNIYGGYNLLQDFELVCKFYHDLSVESQYSIYNVFRKGKGKDINFDHHSQDVRKNLFTNIDLGAGLNIYSSGGSASPTGINTNETYWNITASKDLQYNNRSGTTSTGATLRSTNNVAVGIRTATASAMPDAYGNWYETINPVVLYPKDLYAAQMKLVKNKDIQ